MRGKRDLLEVTQETWEELYRRGSPWTTVEEDNRVRFWLKGGQRLLAQMGRTQESITFYARADYLEELAT